MVVRRYEFYVGVARTSVLGPGLHSRPYNIWEISTKKRQIYSQCELFRNNEHILTKTPFSSSNKTLQQR